MPKAPSNKQMQQTGGALISVRHPQLICVFCRHLAHGRTDDLTAGYAGSVSPGVSSGGRGPSLSGTEDSNES
jgi:hypothetical protein